MADAPRRVVILESLTPRLASAYACLVVLRSQPERHVSPPIGRTYDRGYSRMGKHLLGSLAEKPSDDF